MTALDTYREHYRHRDRAARERKRAGGKVVGYLCDNVPEELIMAAGFLPYRLSGDPRASTDALDTYIQPFAAPFSARNRGVGFVDAMLAKLLSGDFDFLDYLIVPHTRKTIQAFYRELTLARSACPDLSLPELYYLDRAYTPFYTSEVFNRQSLLDLKVPTRSVVRSCHDGSYLAEAVEVTNASRQLLQKIAAIRAARPLRLSGVDALQVIGTSFLHAETRPQRVAGEHRRHADGPRAGRQTPIVRGWQSTRQPRPIRADRVVRRRDRRGRPLLGQPLR